MLHLYEWWFYKGSIQYKQEPHDLEALTLVPSWVFLVKKFPYLDVT